MHFVIMGFVLISVKILQIDYINTSHPNFIGGRKAVEIAQQQVKSSRLAAAMQKAKVFPFLLLCTNYP